MPREGSEIFPRRESIFFLISLFTYEGKREEGTEFMITKETFCKSLYATIQARGSLKMCKRSHLTPSRYYLPQDFQWFQRREQLKFIFLVMLT